MLNTIILFQNYILMAQYSQIIIENASTGIYKNIQQKISRKTISTPRCENVLLINSLWLSDDIWWHKSCLGLDQEMAWCLTAPSHYLFECWLIFYRIIWNMFLCISKFLCTCTCISKSNVLSFNHKKIYLKMFISKWLTFLSGTWVKQIFHQRHEWNKYIINEVAQ